MPRIVLTNKRCTVKQNAAKYNAGALTNVYECTTCNILTRLVSFSEYDFVPPKTSGSFFYKPALSSLSAGYVTRNLQRQLIYLVSGHRIAIKIIILFVIFVGLAPNKASDLKPFTSLLYGNGLGFKLSNGIREDITNTDTGINRHVIFNSRSLMRIFLNFSRN